MTFTCSASYEGVSCPNQDQGDAVYLGFIQLCAGHQEVFEMAAASRYLLDEVTAAAVKRGPLGDILSRFQSAPAIVSPAERPKSTVYFMRNGDYCKIGHSIHPARRLMSIRSDDGTLYPQGVQLHRTSIAATEPGGYRREQELHEKFGHLRHTGEWLKAAPELLAYINNLEAAA